MDESVVLHIDDSPDFRATFADIFRAAGVKVISRRAGDQATDLMAGRDYHILVVDSTGVEFARHSAALRRAAQVPVYLLSALPDSIRPEAIGGQSDLTLSKADNGWDKQILSALRSRFLSPGTTPPRLRLDVFAGATPDRLSAWRGKVLIVAGTPERVVATADTLAEAEDLASHSSQIKEPIQFIQGPPLNDVTLAELEGW